MKLFMKFLLHLRSPLCNKTCRANNKNSADKAPALKFLNNHAGFNRFTEAHLVRKNVADVVCLHSAVEHMDLVRQRDYTAGKR